MHVSQRRLRSTLVLFTALALGLTAADSLARDGKYLIVTATDFSDDTALATLASHRASQGFDVSTYVVPSGTSNTNIRNYISNWYSPSEPCYVVIIGDTISSQYNATASTIPHWQGGGSKHCTTDLPYACMDGGDDWHPDLFVGRISVSSEAELTAVVDKTIYVESGSYPDYEYVTRGAFLATSDSSAQAEATHDWVISNYFVPAGYNAVKIYANQGGGTSEIYDALNAGVLWIVYFGHSSSTGWWTPSFDQGEITSANLHNTGLYPLAFGFSCNTAHFDYTECSGETWIRESNKGSAAYISASTTIYYGGDDWESSRRIEKYFFESFFVDDIWDIGPAWQAGIYRFLNDPDFGDNEKRNMTEMFVTLGDPALELPQPYGFDVGGSPVDLDICSPPYNEAVYTIGVTSRGGFNESVLISATDLPPGATTSIVPNNQPAPFTATLTVGNLSAVPVGDYNINLTGVSASFTENGVVRLHLDNGPPAGVSLIGPASGSVDVERQPTLTWAAAADAGEYHVEIARDTGFNQIVWSATTESTQAMVATYLDSMETYYWRVWASNGCGDGPVSPTWNFTTIDQADYFTEQFSGFDLDGFSLTLTPDGSGSHYNACLEGISLFPTDPAGGTQINVGEDNYEAIPVSTPVHLYGVAYNGFYVGSNGYITFDSGDGTWRVSYDTHFNQPRISPLYVDLSPQYGYVSYRELADRVAVTYENCPEYGNGSSSNNFQVELFHDGRIRMSWAGIDVNAPIAGISRGLGTPSDFLVSDLSAYGPCVCLGDSNCDAVVNWRDIDYFVAGMNDNVTAWEAMFAPGSPACPFIQNDVNGDGTVNWRDIDPLVAIMNTPCP